MKSLSAEVDELQRLHYEMKQRKMQKSKDARDSHQQALFDMMRRKQALELQKEQQKFGGFGTNVKGVLFGKRAKSAAAAGRR